MPLVVLSLFALMVAFGVFSTVLRIGKPAKPITNGVAAGVLFVGALEFAALAYVASQL